MKAITKTNLQFQCPRCEKHYFSYQHLVDQKQTERRKRYEWTCGNCVATVEFSVDWDDLSVNIINAKKPPEGKAKALVLLRLLPVKGTVLKELIHIVVEKKNYSHEEDLKKFSDIAAYWYNDHTCPANYLGVVSVIEGGDDDPHGIFQFVEAIWMPEGFDSCEFHNKGGSWSSLFEKMNKPLTEVDDEDEIPE